MDLYLPEEGENFPLAFIVHGGAWIQGDRKDFTEFTKQLTGMGYAAVTVSYRLVKNGEGQFPDPIEDLRCAVKTLKQSHAQYSFNPDKILSIGQSAGAHLVAELALTADSDQFDDSDCPVQSESPDVQSVVGYFGPYDLRKTQDLNPGQIWLVSNFLGGLPQFKPKLAALASPVAQIHDEEIPFYLVHAADDDVVPVKSSQEFHVALQEKNKDVKYVEVPTGGHTIAFFDDRPDSATATCGMIQTLTEFAL